MQKRFADEQIIVVLRETEVDGAVIREVYHKHNIKEQTFFRWRNKYGDMTVSDARKLKEIESKNARLKKVVAEQMLAIKGLKEITAKKWQPRQPGATPLKSSKLRGYPSVQRVELPG